MGNEKKLPSVEKCCCFKLVSEEIAHKTGKYGNSWQKRTDLQVDKPFFLEKFAKELWTEIWQNTISDLPGFAPS